jgi:hypothetical protein
VKSQSVVLHRSVFNQRLAGFKALLSSLKNVSEISDIVVPEIISASQAKQSSRTVFRYGLFEFCFLVIFPTKWSGCSQLRDVSFVFMVKARSAKSPC